MSAPELREAAAGAPARAVGIAVRGRLEELDEGQLARLVARGRATDAAVAGAVTAVVAAVRERGDEALRELARRFDGVELDELEVPRSRLDDALFALPGDLRAALELAVERLTAFHRAQLPQRLEVEVSAGVHLGRHFEPLGRVGVYAPGGTAAYPSSVLMGVVPARVAGVGEIVVCSPPGPGGAPPPVVLAACALAGVDRVFALGGAGAIAAMAYGTATVPRVAKVVGPGNAYVDEAKRQLAGTVAVDLPAGPSDVLVIADQTAAADLVAAELLAQAEHDADAAAVLVTTDPTLPERVMALLGDWLPAQPRLAVIEASLAKNGALLVASSLDAALTFAQRYAPEHLALLVREPRRALEGVRCAGTVTLGGASSVVFGDYVSGANHVLPTSGRAAAWSGLSTLDFLRSFTVQELTAEAAAALAGPTVVLARAEGFPAHALAASLRMDAVSRAAARPPLAGSAAGPSAGSAADTPRNPLRVPLASPRPRACVEELTPYDPGRLPCGVDLSDNTNRWGVPPSAAAVLAASDAERVSRYPTPYSAALVAALADLHGVGPGNVVVGCGSDDVLDSTLRAFCGPGARVAFPVPTFGVVPLFARVGDGQPVGVPLAADLSLDEDGLATAGAAATYVCRPNNPTGTRVPRTVLERLAARLPGLLLADEAYVDFAGTDGSAAAWAATSRNVVVLRTLSKAWGLAGLRVGYAVGPPAAIAAIATARGPYKVGGVAEAAALAALASDRGWVAERVGLAIAARERLSAALRDDGWEVLPSAANFVFVRLPATSGGAVATAAALRARGVAVRPFAGLPGVGDGLRVTVGPEPQLARFLEALGAVARSWPAAAAVGG
jgi:histidinol dehydrogenase